jgi:hypothetical protein
MSLIAALLLTATDYQGPLVGGRHSGQYMFRYASTWDSAAKIVNNAIINESKGDRLSIDWAGGFINRSDLRGGRPLDPLEVDSTWFSCGAPNEKAGALVLFGSPEDTLPAPVYDVGAGSIVRSNDAPQRRNEHGVAIGAAILRSGMLFGTGKDRQRIELESRYEKGLITYEVTEDRETGLALPLDRGLRNAFQTSGWRISSEAALTNRVELVRGAFGYPWTGVGYTAVWPPGVHVSVRLSAKRYIVKLVPMFVFDREGRVCSTGPAVLHFPIGEIAGEDQ